MIKHKAIQYRYAGFTSYSDIASSSVTVIGRKCIEMVTVNIKGKWNKHQINRKIKYVKSRVNIVFKKMLIDKLPVGVNVS